MKRIGTICLALAVLSAICLSFAACPSPTSSAPAYKPAAADVVTAMGSATPIQTATGSPLSV